jgi:hypothetical protein
MTPDDLEKPYHVTGGGPAEGTVDFWLHARHYTEFEKRHLVAKPLARESLLEFFKTARPNNMFCVMGGRGEYDLSLYRGGDEIHYWDGTRSDEVIRIWESDQGSSKSYQNLCNDLPLVLEITRRFAESREFHPGVCWDKW